MRGIRLLMDSPPTAPASSDEIKDWDSLSHVAAHRIVNIGNSKKVRLLDFIDAIESQLGKKAIRNYMGMQPGDVPATWANAKALKELTGYRPETDIEEGIRAFIKWFREYYGK